MLRRRPLPQLHVGAVAIIVMALAFAVRLLWILRVQSPHGAVYSDMAAYVVRAEELLGLIPPSAEPRMLAFYPWGAHTFIAGEFAVFGRTSLVGIGCVHAFVSSIPAACAVLLTVRFVPSRFAAACAGLTVAIWQPQIANAAFFMSEMWFSAAIMIAAWLFVRHCEGSRAASLGAGCALAVAFTVRPQVLLTVALVGALCVPMALRELRWSRFGRENVWRWVVLFAPLVVAVGVSAERFHRLTGHYGLIAENGPVNRLFGDTHVGKVESTWTAPNGVRHTAWYSPGGKLPVRPEDIVRFEGYIGDADIVDNIRLEYLRGVPLLARIERAGGNVALLWRNLPNPEEDFRADRRRRYLQRSYRKTALSLLPLAAIGVWFMRRRHAAGAAVVVANLLTVVIVAALFFAEGRFRVPYDPFFIVAATVGAAAILRQLDRLRLRIVDRVAARRAARLDGAARGIVAS